MAAPFPLVQKKPASLGELAGDAVSEQNRDDSLFFLHHLLRVFALFLAQETVAIFVHFGE